MASLTSQSGSGPPHLVLMAQRKSLLPDGETLPWQQGRYCFLERSGHRGEAELFRAMDTAIGRQVAIKAFPRMKDSRGAAQTAFLKEGRALAILNHPHIAQIYDCLEIRGVPCLVMEWVVGVPLTEIDTGTGQARIEAILRAIFSALEEAHRCGLIHRDLKPEHILAGEREGVKLIDFGLVKRFGTALDSLSSTPLEEAWRGTPAYMAPEQIKGGAVDWRADQFSLAIVLSEWLFGQHPFQGANPAIFLHRIAYEEPSFASGGQRNAHPRIQSVLNRALAKRPDDRWPTLEAFRNRLFERWC